MNATSVTHKKNGKKKEKEKEPLVQSVIFLVADFL
jgi:hypothetical protein